MSKLDPDTIKKLQKAGLLQSKFADYMQIGIVYKKEYEKTGSKMEAYTNTADMCCKSEDRVRKIVAMMKGLI